MKEQMKNVMRSLFLLSAVVFFSQCDTEEPVAENEEELITTLTMTFTPTAGGDPVVLSVFDADGDGPIEPVYTDGDQSALAAVTTYNVSLQVLNTTENPAENITEEILEEDEEHQFFFQFSNGLNLNFAYDDLDDNENPIGVSSVFTTGDASTGTMTVTLRHEPAKSADGVANGEIANAGGETDIQAVFDVVIE